MPGGFGFADQLTDSQTLEFLRRHGHHARYVTSVCNGSLLLGAAGLLQAERFLRAEQQIERAALVA